MQSDDVGMGIGGGCLGSRRYGLSQRDCWRSCQRGD